MDNALPDSPNKEVEQPPGARPEDVLDCIIVGAGPAGLTALIYLARFRRKVVALGGGGSRPRLLLIERTYNLPGYPEGVPGPVILRRLREQAEEFGGEALCPTAERIDGADGNFRVLLSEGATLCARKIILAMGIRDREPDITGISDHIGRFLRYCPVCDGYEHTDKSLGILGSGPAVARHSLFLRSFSNCITLFLHGEDPSSLGKYAAILAKKGIAVEESRITRILEEETDGGQGCRGTGVRLENGTEYPLEALYISLGCHVNLGPVAHLPIKVDEDGFVITDAYQETSVPGIYAAGDLVSQLSQISVAFGQAAVAAVRIHNELDNDEDEPEAVTSQSPGVGVE